MDPVTAIGVIGSVVQLSQAAFSLSKTLYSLVEAVASASEDVQMLADDLKTFSCSLTVLSRLLEDSKAWYSDDVYLLTAKIIKDCADLYAKIDKLLIKLGANSTSTWKLRVKFVYKEGQIRKLTKRLRDMKGTLATIVMSLQVDLQLSLLDISSSSQVQRARERPLQPKTVQSLLEARDIAQQIRFTSIHPTDPVAPMLSGQTVQPLDHGPGVLTSQPKSQVDQSCRAPLEGEIKPDSGFAEIHLTTSTSGSEDLQGDPLVSSLPSTRSRPAAASSSARVMEGLPVHQIHATSLMAQHPFDNRPDQVNNKAISDGTATTQSTEEISLRSTASFDSFHSAVSVQESAANVAGQAKAVHSVLHAFRIAIEVLQALMEKRLRQKEHKKYRAARGLKWSLIRGEKWIDKAHNTYIRQYGDLYSLGFKDTHATELQNVSSTLLKEVVTRLHTYSAPYFEIQEFDFGALHAWSEQCQVQAISQIDNVAHVAEETGAPSTRHELYAIWGSPPMEKPHLAQLEQAFSTGPQIPEDYPDFWRPPSQSENTFPSLNFSDPVETGATMFEDNSASTNHSEWKDFFPSPPGFDYFDFDGGHIAGSPSRDFAFGADNAMTGPSTVYEQEQTSSPHQHRSHDPFKKLWWEAYAHVNTSTFNILSDSLYRKLGTLPSNFSDKTLSEITGPLVEKIGKKKHLRSLSNLKCVTEHHDNIIKVTTTISSQLGLERPGLGWSCVAVFLAIYEDIFDEHEFELIYSNPQISEARLKDVTNRFRQVEDLVGLLARYAVMENLYYQSQTLSLTKEYQAALLDLCIAILTYFAHAFTTARTYLQDPQDDKAESIEGSEECDKLIDEIKEKNKACQGFCIVVEAEDESDSDSDTEIEDVSDMSDETCDELPHNEISATLG